MSKYDPFFSSPVDPELNKKILLSAQDELDFNRTIYNRKKWLSFLAPLTAALASFFAFKLVKTNKFDDVLNEPEQIDLVATLMEHEEVMDILQELQWLEDLDVIEEIEVESV